MWPPFTSQLLDFFCPVPMLHSAQLDCPHVSRPIVCSACRDLADNRLSGTIPIELARLTMLQSSLCVDAPPPAMQQRCPSLSSASPSYGKPSARPATYFMPGLCSACVHLCELSLWWQVSQCKLPERHHSERARAAHKAGGRHIVCACLVLRQPACPSFLSVRHALACTRFACVQGRSATASQQGDGLQPLEWHHPKRAWAAHEAGPVVRARLFATLRLCARKTYATAFA